jgi:oxygen-independent coproporphyrinogen-3 oxidase
MIDLVSKEKLFRRYDGAGPRYTSYPTATEFSEHFDPDAFEKHLHNSNESLIPRPLSFYIHLPFCRHLCFFCACNKIVTRDETKALGYLDWLKHEIEILCAKLDTDRRVIQLHLGGGTPTFFQPEQIRQLVDHIQRHTQLPLSDDREWSIEIDPRTVSRDSLKQLHDVGFNRISVGVQDLDTKVQQAIHRTQSPPETIEVINHARDVGFQSVCVDLIIGLPFQTSHSFARTLSRLLFLRPNRFAIFPYAHLPHRFTPQQRILATDLPSAKERLKIFELALRTLTEAGYVHVGLDHFVLPEDPLARAQRNGSLCRNFQGYATLSDCDLIGFGTSAISKLARCYSQNSHDLTKYLGEITHQRLPITRGISLSDDDLIRRRVIEQLMCFGRVDLGLVLESYWDVTEPVDYFPHELSKLIPFANDGLLTLSPDFIIEVTPLGRFLVRAICMVFDRYRNEATAVSHSRLT